MAADINPAPPPGSTKARGSELALRVASALVLAPLAIAAAWFGGWPFAVFWGLAAVGVLWEWTELVARAERRAILGTGGAALVLAVALAVTGRFDRAIILVAMGAIAAAAFAPRGKRAWTAGGVLYAGAIGLPPVVLRGDLALGFAAVIFLFAVVWATDIVAYFAGRAIGGPKLIPRVSPKKTWSGAVGGAVAAVVAAVLMVEAFDLPNLGWVVLAALVLSVASQGGDLFESAVKRRFDVKDASHLIPGHGGLMDRLDGFVAAATVAALIGVARGGIDMPAAGLLVW